MQKAKILIIDDLDENREFLSDVICHHTPYEAAAISTGVNLVSDLNQEILPLPDLILLDIMMPDMDGFEVAAMLKADSLTREIPIIFLTSLIDSDFAQKAFSVGAVDFISEPVEVHELISRIDVHIKLKQTKDNLAKKNEAMENSMISTLENINYYNDSDTGFHIKRVSEYSALIAASYGCCEGFISKLMAYASLHDMGKVGIADEILKKPDAYTPDEFEAMKQHVIIGSKMLSNMDIDRMAKNIVLYHHEKWDGTGYLSGLSGEDIPLEARIVALADAYDALSSKRCYKEAYSQEKVEEIIKEQSGKHFDPKVVDAFFDAKDKIIAICKRYSEL